MSTIVEKTEEKKICESCISCKSPAVSEADDLVFDPLNLEGGLNSLESFRKTIEDSGVFLKSTLFFPKYFVPEIVSLVEQNFCTLSLFFGRYGILRHIVGGLVLIIFLLIAVAYYTLAERKIMASMQRRVGPNVVGFWGLLQPLADGLKLLLKEIIVPRKANKILFILAPILTFALALVNWTVIPFSSKGVFAEVNLGIIFILTISSLSVYGVIIAGWASNSKYAFLGALRSTAQMISYEIAISFILVTILLFVGSFNLTDIVNAQATCWFLLPLLPLFIIFLVCMLAETNRTPFDLPEAEAELVAGYNVDYSSIMFAMFFLGEYSNMLLMSCLAVILFCGGWLFPILDLFLFGEIIFALKVSVFAVFFIWVRATLPRYRYDQLMSLGWKVFLPFTLGFFIFILGILIFFNCIPYLRKGSIARYNPFGYAGSYYKQAKIGYFTKLITNNYYETFRTILKTDCTKIIYPVHSKDIVSQLPGHLFQKEACTFEGYSDIFRESRFNQDVFSSLTGEELLWLQLNKFGVLYYNRSLESLSLQRVGVNSYLYKDCL